MPTQLEPEIEAAFMQNIPTKNYPKFLTLFGTFGPRLWLYKLGGLANRVSMEWS